MNNKREQRCIEFYDNVSQKAQKPQKILFYVDDNPP